MHRLLESQLKKFFGSLEDIPDEWKALLEEVSFSYQEADQERAILEKTIREMGKPQRTPTIQISRTSSQHQDNINKPDPIRSLKRPNARAKGKTVLRKAGAKDTNGESRVAVPIKLREQTLGVINLSFEDAETARQNAPLLEQLSSRLALAMENARLFAETQISLTRTNALLQVSRAAVAFEDIPELSQSLVDSIAETLPADRVSLISFDLDQKQITGFYTSGPGDGQTTSSVTFDELNHGLSGWVIRKKKPALSPKDVPDPRESAEVQQRRRETNCGSVLVVPLLYRGQITSTLTAINAPEQPDFTDQDAELMMAMASQGATAIENARLFQIQQRRAAELQAAAEVSRAASSILELDLLLEQTVEVIRERFGLYYVGIFLVDESGDWAELRAGTGEAGRIQIERQHKLRVGGESMIGQCVAISAARISQDVGGESLRFKNPILPDTQSEMALPLISRGETIGAMTIQSVLPAAFSQESISTLQTMADQLANAIQNAQLFTQSEARAIELSILNEMARTLAETLDVDSIIEQVYQFASRLIDTDNFYLALHFPELSEIEFMIYTVDGKRVTVQDQRRKAGKGLTEHVIHTRSPLFIEEKVDEYIESLTGVEAIGQSSQCWLGVPMVAGNQVIGVINVQHYTTPHYFKKQDQQLLIAVASQAAIAIQNGRLFEQTQRQNQDLGVLNEMGSVLNAILERETILEKIHEYTSHILDFTSFVIAFHHPDQDEITIPIAIENGERLSPKRLPKKGGLLNYVIRTKSSLLLQDNVSTRAKELGIDADVIRTTGEPALSWIGTPIQAGTTILGVLSIQSTIPQTRYTDRHRDLLISIANLAANALENARLFEQTQLQNRELAVLNEMGRVLNALLDREKIIESIHEYASRLVDFTSFVVALYNEEKDEINFPFAVEKGETISVPTVQGTNSLIGYVINSKAPLLIPENIEARAAEIGISFRTVGEPAKSWLSTPILIGQTVIGAISVQTISTPNQYTERHRDLIISISNQAAIALQNAALFEQAQRQNEELATLNEMSRVLTNLLDVESITEQIYRYTIHLIQTLDFFVAFYDEESKEVSFPFVVDEGARIEVPTRPLGNSLTDYVIRKGTPLLLKEALDETISSLGIEQIIIGAESESWLGVPMKIGQQIAGVVGVQSIETPNAYSERDQDILSAIASQAAIAIQNARSFEQTQQALAEAETLYQASAELNAVQTYDDILGVLQKYTVLGHASTHTISLNMFEQPWTREQTPEYLISLAQWSRVPESSPHQSRYPLSEWPTAPSFFNAESATFVENIEADGRIKEETTLAAYKQKTLTKSMVFAPLIVAREWIGHLIAFYDQITPVSPQEIRRLTALAQQATVALQNLRLLEESRQRASQLLTAAEIARSASETLAQEELLFRAVNLIRDRFGFYHASVFLLDDSRQWALISESTGEAGAEMKRRGHRLEVGSQSIVGTVTITGNPLIVNDVTKDGVHQPNPLLPETKAEMGIPLKLGRRVIGALDVQSTEVDAFTPGDVAVLQILADQVAIAVDNSRSYAIAQEAVKDANDRLEEISMLFEISQSLASAPLLTEQIAEVIASRIIRVVGGSSTCGVSVYESETDMMRVLADVTNQNGKNTLTEDPAKWDFKLSDYPASAQVMKTLEPKIVQADDPNADPNELQYLKQTGSEMLLILPLASKGQAFGLIEIESLDKKRFYTPDQINLALTVANQGAAAIENARLYEEQIKTAEQLREVDKLKNQFLANMSHELRTPLNSIIGFSRVILKGIDGPVTDTQEQDLTAIYNAGTHLLGLINDILDISRIEAGKMELSFEQVNLETLITSVMSTAKGLVKERSVRLETHFEPNLPLIKADPTRLRQVILNLLQNASKFTEEGTISVKAVSQINARGKQEVMISVSDTGVGIAPEDQEKLFQPFSQVDASPTRKAGGTGLGLSITRNLIELHGGHIDLISDVGKGSTFFFTIPAMPATGALAAQEVGSLEKQEKENRKIVLAIEDDENIIQLYKRYLGPEGYQVIPLTDSSIAVQQAKEIQPFAITLDVHMPNLDGWQVIKALKSNDETRRIPVIFCTIVENQAKGYSLGAADYLLKPILGEDLINALERLESNTEIKHILVIDDDPDDLRLVEKTLQLSGTYQVRLAQGGQKGLDAMRKNKPDAVILDLSMPDVDGFEVLNNMRADRKLKDTPVIILTALELNVDQQKLLSEYTQEQLRKGFLDTDGLLVCLQQTFRNTKHKSVE